MKDAKGSTVNLLMTSHEETTVGGGWAIKSKYYLYKGYKIIRDDHIHPDGNTNPSKETGDLGHGTLLLEYSPDAKFRILAKGKYYNYYPPKPSKR